MYRRLLVSVIAAWAGLASTTLIVPAETAFPPGLRIGLDPPGDMKLSTRLPGFEDPERNAVIAILDLPASAYRDLENSAFSLTQQGLDQLKRESFPFENGIGFLISGIAQQNGAKITAGRYWPWPSASPCPTSPCWSMWRCRKARCRSTPMRSFAKRSQASRSDQRPLTNNSVMLPFNLGDLSGFQVMQVMPTGTVFLADGPPTTMNANLS